MPRLLIAGYGFLGEALKLHFTSLGWDVDALSLSGTEAAIACDLSSSAAVMQWDGEYDLIIHCAATRGGGVSAYRSIYLDGCRNLRNRFPATPIIFTSSTSVYGQVDHQQVTEQSLACPASATSQVLRDAEAFILEGEGVVLRLSALCGPGRCHTLTSFLNGSARIDGDGARVLNFVHRDDVASACLLIIDRWSVAVGEVFNVSAASLSQRQCYQSLADHYRREFPQMAGPGQRPKLRGVTSKSVVSDKIRAMGWAPISPDFLSIAKKSNSDPTRK